MPHNKSKLILTVVREGIKKKIRFKKTKQKKKQLNMVARYFELRMLQKKNQYKQKLTVFYIRVLK